jgi:hypothetical protein
MGLGRTRALWIIGEALSPDALGFFRAVDVDPVVVAAHAAGDEESTPVVHGAGSDSRALSA